MNPDRWASLVGILFAVALWLVLWWKWSLFMLVLCRAVAFKCP